MKKSYRGRVFLQIIPSVAYNRPALWRLVSWEMGGVWRGEVTSTVGSDLETYLQSFLPMSRYFSPRGFCIAHHDRDLFRKFLGANNLGIVWLDERPPADEFVRPFLADERFGLRKLGFLTRFIVCGQQICETAFYPLSGFYEIGLTIGEVQQFIAEKLTARFGVWSDLERRQVFLTASNLAEGQSLTGTEGFVSVCEAVNVLVDYCVRVLSYQSGVFSDRSGLTELNGRMLPIVAGGSRGVISAADLEGRVWWMIVRGPVSFRRENPRDLYAHLLTEFHSLADISEVASLVLRKFGISKGVRGNE